MLVLLALPFLGVRYGFPDAGNDRAGTTTRQAYDMLADGFGPGANGPLLLVSEGDGAALAPGAGPGRGHTGGRGGDRRRRPRRAATPR